MKWLTCYQGMLDLRATFREGVRRYTRACGKEPVQGRRLDRGGSMSAETAKATSPASESMKTRCLRPCLA